MATSKKPAVKKRAARRRSPAAAGKVRYALEFSIVEITPHADGGETSFAMCKWCMPPIFEKSLLEASIQKVAKTLRTQQARATGQPRQTRQSGPG
jgi:hypothetical protein